MNYFLKSEGKLEISNGAVRLKVSMDFIRYYKSLIDKEYRIFSNFPAHGSHITLFHPKIHGVLDSFKVKFIKKFYMDNKIPFEYNPYIIQGGHTKNFRNWYLNVKSVQLNEIVNYLGASVGHGLHLTICNTKGGVRPYIWLK
jgi:hypothetical protein